MRFLVDECTGPKLASWLRESGHDVLSVYEEAPGMSDNDIIKISYKENRILITNDKDFGEKVFKEGQPHKGIILLHLRDERPSNKIETIKRLIHGHEDKLANNFVVVTEKNVRFAISK